MKIANNITNLVGNTPLVYLKKISPKGVRIIGKLEFFNPAGSIKDRIALAMILDAEKKGIINKDTTIIEATSGNTGIGLAFVCASRGYKLILVMPESMSIERRKLLQFLGAQLILTPGNKGMKGAVEKAEELSKEIGNSFMPRQFDNPANPNIHRETTGPEIWKDTQGNIDVLVAGIGTGGTITGVGEFLKKKKNTIQIVGVEPKKSAVLSGGAPGPHRIQGIGAGFIPKILNQKIIDHIIAVEDEDAMDMAKRLSREEGIMVGISSGAAVWAAVEITKREEFHGKNIIVILPDTGERYLSIW